MPLQIRSADSTVLWRTGEGVVQRSADGGVSWITQNTGTTAVMLAGSSPSAQVCWLVGRAGAVLLSPDGIAWQPRRFTEPLDLVAVRAVDARAATVTAADGRQFSTADGGLTWTPLQESPSAPF
jgi:photosystem II stability/assembly factor-like uncharacterized protein